MRAAHPLSANKTIDDGKIQRAGNETAGAFKVMRMLPLPTRGWYTRGGNPLSTRRGGGDDGRHRNKKNTTSGRSRPGRSAGRVRCICSGVLGEEAVQPVERRRSEKVHE